MKNEPKVLTASSGIMRDTWQQGGLAAILRKIWAATRLNLPFNLGRHTHGGVNAFYDLVTDEARIFYGDSFHFGLFTDRVNTLGDALDALTDLMAEMAGAPQAASMIDIGCGVCGPAVRIAQRHPGLHITGVNNNGEQVRQARALVAERGLSERLIVKKANALALPFESSRFDAALSLEVATNICVRDGDRRRYVAEMKRVIAPAGRVGFCDVVFRKIPTPAENRVLERIFYHDGSQFVADWPGIFQTEGFQIEANRDILALTQKTWELSRAVYEQRTEEVNRRYGRNIATQIIENLARVPEILDRYAEYPVLSMVRADPPLQKQTQRR